MRRWIVSAVSSTNGNAPHWSGFLTRKIQGRLQKRVLKDSLRRPTENARAGTAFIRHHSLHYGILHF